MSASPVQSWINLAALAGIIAIGVFAPALLTLGIVYGRRTIRAFSIAALFPAALLLVATVCVIVVGVMDNDWDEFLDSEGLVGGLLVAVVMMGACGLLGAVTGRFFETKQQSHHHIEKRSTRVWQFSLGKLLLVMALLSVTFAVLFALPDIIAAFVLTVLALVMPMALFELILYGPPRFRPALIGTIASAVPLFCTGVVIFVIAVLDDGWGRVLADNDVSRGIRIASGVTWLAMLFVGGLCQLVVGIGRHGDESDNPGE